MAGRNLIIVENVNTPGRTAHVNAEKYSAMREALLKALPARRPGLTQQAMIGAVLPFLPEALWPAGAKAAWWVKTVQLDLEAKGLVLRETIDRRAHWRRAAPPAR